MMHQQIVPIRAWDQADPGVIELNGYLDKNAASEIEEDARLCIASGIHEFVLDCEQLTFISETGIHALFEIAQEIQAVKGRLAACNLQPQVRDAFDASGLDFVIPVYDTQFDAKHALVA